MTSITSNVTFEFFPKPELPCDDGSMKKCLLGVLRYQNRTYDVAALSMRQFPTDEENKLQSESFHIELKNYRLLNKHFPNCKYFSQLIIAYDTTFCFRRCLGDLETLILNSAFPTSGRICRWDDRIKLARSTLMGVNFLHTHGIVHLDVKAENILVTDNPYPQAKLCDLRTMQHIQHPNARYYAGSFCFASPQCCFAFANHRLTIAQGESVFDDEIWRVGVVLQRLLEGKEHAWIDKGTKLYDQDVKEFLGGPSLDQYNEICKYCKDDTRLNFLGLTHFDPKKRPSLADALLYFDIEVALMRMEG